MSKFSDGKGKEPPKVSTASLPDIVFMLLFFFMVTTVLRDAELKVAVTVPQATELTKLEQKSLVHYLYVGRPTQKYQSLYGTRPTLQLGDKIASIEDIPIFIEKHKIKVNESQHGRITSSLRVDGDVTMGIVQDVKTKLRKSNQLRVNYSAKPRVE
ncbi:MAG: biopolymer transporter ExbD [Bacteroidota bacterium]